MDTKSNKGRQKFLSGRLIKERDYIDSIKDRTYKNNSLNEED